MSIPNWCLPFDYAHDLVGTAGRLTFVGGAGDFDHQGCIRHPGDLPAQIEGALQNANAALAAECCTLADAVRVKAYYLDSEDVSEWQIIAALTRALPTDPAPAITVQPVVMAPFPGQCIQIQIIAQQDWRQSGDVRHATEEVPAAQRSLFAPATITRALRAGEFFAVAGRTAADANDALTSDDRVEQSHQAMQSLGKSLQTIGAGFQDAVKMEGYYFGTTFEQWAPLADARASYFREPGPVATVVPCHSLHPHGALTKIELLGMRTCWNGFDKYIPREDCWPARVWDWPRPLPYRQGLRLRDTIWTGGQVPMEPGRNGGEFVYAGELLAQTRFTMSYIEDILRGFSAVSSDLALLVCYYTSNGDAGVTDAFVAMLRECVAGPLPPLTLVPQPHMHSDDVTVEIWGVARG